MANEDVKRFSELLRKKEATEQAAVAAERAARDAAKRLAAAKADKESAEALRLARQSGKADRVAEADSRYRSALAALVEVEQGKRPDWAPVEPEVDDAALAVSSTESEAESDADGAPADGVPAERAESAETVESIESVESTES
jgi:hypothetical protein